MALLSHPGRTKKPATLDIFIFEIRLGFKKEKYRKSYIGREE
jgi:hypothetical protein